MTKDNPLVSIIIPHWNGIEILSECIDSLLKTNFESFEIIVVDNASSDGAAVFCPSRPQGLAPHAHNVPSVSLPT